ncbi:uncharacterized protein LOC113920080 isoform X2 [Zalophus californianus]|uniref:Uncharacterized protein LOC113920080 isoform X2 n=1 Tax=Zalophus californianus TaxID=9704 RepID=A0A6J2CRL8_ZALCA|nr:uncharacterized protein LOC113920080 isoform X2 [Zalophus californianus]
MEIGKINSKKENGEELSKEVGSVLRTYLPQSPCSLLLKGSKEAVSLVLATRSSNAICLTVGQPLSQDSSDRALEAQDVSSPAPGTWQLLSEDLLSELCQEIDKDNRDLMWPSTAEEVTNTVPLSPH